MADPVPPRCGVVVPARDEASMIARCLEALHDGLPRGFARIVVACNGCRDGTPDLARRFASDDLVVLDLPEGGKAKAIRAAERLLPDGPRVYLDADVEFRGRDLVRLVERLEAGPFHLLAPAIDHDHGRCTPGARAVSRVWLSLPHARSAAFHHVLGVSGEGRRRWDEFPELIADDAFIAARFRPDERRIVPDLRVHVRPPRTVGAWIGVRTRWLKGDRQLSAMGLGESVEPGQRSGLVRLALQPSMLPGVLLYLAVRVAARLRAGRRGGRSDDWFRDETSRR